MDRAVSGRRRHRRPTPSTACSRRAGRTPSARIRWAATCFSRVVFGARTSLRIAIESLAIAALIGIPLGVVAGYVGGWVDDVIMRITDVFLAFPALLLALALEAVI